MPYPEQKPKDVSVDRHEVTPYRAKLLKAAIIFICVGVVMLLFSNVLAIFLKKINSEN